MLVGLDVATVSNLTITACAEGKPQVEMENSIIRLISGHTKMPLITALGSAISSTIARRQRMHHALDMSFSGDSSFPMASVTSYR